MVVLEARVSVLVMHVLEVGQSRGSTKLRLVVAMSYFWLIQIWTLVWFLSNSSTWMGSRILFLRSFIIIFLMSICIHIWACTSRSSLSRRYFGGPICTSNHAAILILLTSLGILLLIQFLSGSLRRHLHIPTACSFGTCKTIIWILGGLRPRRICRLFALFCVIIT